MARLSLISASLLALALAAAPATAAPSRGRPAGAEARLDALERRVRELEDVRKIETLTRAYAFYVSKGQWSQIMALFSSNPSVEIAQGGIYVGPEATRKVFMGAMGGGHDCLRPGMLFNHFVLEPLITVAAGGRTATGRAHLISMVGAAGAPNGNIQEGVYDFAFEKSGDDIWRISKLRFVNDIGIGVPGGFSRFAQPTPVGAPPGVPPPDRPPTADNAGGFPVNYILPYQFPNPVTGAIPDTSACQAARQ